METKKPMLFIVATIFFSLLVSVNSAYAKQDDDTRPGWGFGDTNHEHTGPPGLTVRPNNNQLVIVENDTDVNVLADTSINNVSVEKGNVKTGNVNVFVVIVNQINEEVRNFFRSLFA